MLVLQEITREFDMKQRPIIGQIRGFFHYHLPSAQCQIKIHAVLGFQAVAKSSFFQLTPVICPLSNYIT